jgi:hypothetical protein
MPGDDSPRFGEIMAYVVCIIVSTAMIWYLFIIDIRAVRTMHRKNAGLYLYFGILSGNCIFQDPAFQTVIPGKSGILHVLFFDSR